MIKQYADKFEIDEKLMQFVCCEILGGRFGVNRLIEESIILAIDNKYRFSFSSRIELFELPDECLKFDNYYGSTIQKMNVHYLCSYYRDEFYAYLEENKIDKLSLFKKHNLDENGNYYPVEI